MHDSCMRFKQSFILISWFLNVALTQNVVSGTTNTDRIQTYKNVSHTASGGCAHQLSLYGGCEQLSGGQKWEQLL